MWGRRPSCRHPTRRGCLRGRQHSRTRARTFPRCRCTRRHIGHRTLGPIQPALSPDRRRPTRRPDRSRSCCRAVENLHGTAIPVDGIDLLVPDVRGFDHRPGGRVANRERVPLRGVGRPCRRVEPIADHVDGRRRTRWRGQRRRHGWRDRRPRTNASPAAPAEQEERADDGDDRDRGNRRQAQYGIHGELGSGDCWSGRSRMVDRNASRN